MKMSIFLFGLVFVSPFIISTFTMNTGTSDCFCYDAPEYSDVPIGWTGFLYTDPGNLSRDLSWGWYVCNASNHVWNASIPDWSGMFLIGWNESDGTMGTNTLDASGGSLGITMSLATMASHTHTYTRPNQPVDFRAHGGGTIANQIEVRTALVASGSAGSASPVAWDNRPPFKVVYYIIYLGV